jgi:hypothetical protein
MISYLLELEPTDATLEYIGVDLDDMGSAMSRYVLRRPPWKNLKKEAGASILKTALAEVASSCEKV